MCVCIVIGFVFAVVLVMRLWSLFSTFSTCNVSLTQYGMFINKKICDSVLSITFRDGLCPSEYCAVTLLTFFGGLFFRDEVPRRVDQSIMIVLTGYTFRAVGITLVLYSVADAPSMAALSAILVFAAIFRLRAANNSTNEQLQQSAYGGIVRLLCYAPC